MNTTNKKINIAFLNPFYKPCIGGAEISLEKIIKGLKKHRVVKTYLITSNVDRKGNFIRSRDRVTRNIYRIGFTNSIKIENSSVWKDVVSKKHYQKLFETLSMHDFIYLNSTLYIKDYENFKRLAESGKPVVIKIIYTKALDEINDCLNLIVKTPHVYIHCISEKIKLELLKMGIPESQLFLCPNPVDTELFHSCRNHVIDKQPVKYIYTGRLAPQKNIPGMVDLFRKIQKVSPDSQLTIIGRVTHPEMEPVIAGLKKTNPNITWLPEVGNRNIGSYLRKSDFFLMTSKDEGMSNSLLEAMSCGLCPIVPKNISGMKDLIEHEKNGLYYSVNNIQALIKRLENITGKDVQKMGVQARNTVVRKCNVNTVVNEHIKFYYGKMQ